MSAAVGRRRAQDEAGEPADAHAPRTAPSGLNVDACEFKPGGFTLPQQQVRSAVCSCELPRTTMSQHDDVPVAPLDLRVDNGTEVWVVFDLNGTLLAKPKGRRDVATPRPGLSALQRLHDHGFKLAVWTSAMQHNSIGLVASLTNAITHKAAAHGEGEGQGQGQRRAKLAWRGFECVLTRQHTRPKPPPREKKWDTVKPLGRYFSHLAHVVLVDDSHKSAPGEATNHILVPTWRWDPNDSTIPFLVDQLISRLGALDGSDVRLHTAAIAQALAAHAPPQSPAATGGAQVKSLGKKTGKKEAIPPKKTKKTKKPKRKRKQEAMAQRDEIATCHTPAHGASDNNAVAKQQQEQGRKLKRKPKRKQKQQQQQQPASAGNSATPAPRPPARSSTKRKRKRKEVAAGQAAATNKQPSSGKQRKRRKQCPP